MLNLSHDRTRTAFEPLQAETYKDRVIRLLSETILSGKVRAGERLNESQLARELNLSRIPVREALQTLEELGLVVNIPRRGNFVINLSEDEIQKINSFRVIAEAEALRLCKAKVTPKEIEKLIQLIERMGTAETLSQSETWKLELEFHRAIWNISGNDYLEKILTMMIVPLFAHHIITSFDRQGGSSRMKYHWSFLDYVRGKSKRSAEEVMLEHLKAGFDNPERFSSHAVRKTGGKPSKSRGHVLSKSERGMKAR